MSAVLHASGVHPLGITLVRVPLGVPDPIGYSISVTASPPFPTDWEFRTGPLAYCMRRRSLTDGPRTL